MLTTVRADDKLAALPVLMLSTWTTEEAKATLDALEAGAMDFLPKRFDELSNDHHESRQKLCDRIHLLTQHGLNAQNTKQSIAIYKTPPIPSSAQTLELVVIGTSMGGPVALQKVLTKLSTDFPFPIILLQDRLGTYTPSFAEHLNMQYVIGVKEAQKGDILQAGFTYLAPSGRLLLVKGRTGRLFLHIERGSESLTYRPCIDITLASIARICPAKTLTIILTGMGTDSSEGAKTMHQLGVNIWSQVQQTSTIYGMLMAIAKAGIADKIIGLTEIGQQLMVLR